MMKQGDLFKKIGYILTELQDQYQYLAENPQEVNALELELFLSNANFLTDHIHIVMKAISHQEVKAIDAPAPVTTKSAVKEEIFRPDTAPATFEFMMDDHTGHDKFEYEEKKVDEIFNRPLTPEEQQIIAQKQAAKPVETLSQKLTGDDEIGPEPFLVPPTQEPVREEPLKVEVIKQAAALETPAMPKVQQEEIKEETAPAKVEVPLVKTTVIPEKEPLNSNTQEAAVKPTLNELLGSSRNLNTNAEPSRVEIKDLKQAISLNDKLVFIKDLFHGYGLAYAEAIDLVNKMHDFKTADTFLKKNYAVQNDWKSKQETVDRFYEILSRRFPVK
jgi:hypothetical protein